MVDKNNEDENEAIDLADEPRLDYWSLRHPKVL